MRIERAQLHVVSMPLRAAFESAAGRVETRHIVLLSLEAGGLEGWGECVASEQPAYGVESLGEALQALQQVLVPAVVGREFPNPESLAAHLFGLTDGVTVGAAAWATVEMAFWDVWARAAGRPLWQLLGGVRDRVPAAVGLGLQPSVAATLEAVARHVAAGYQRIKLKIRPGWDVAVVAAVREEFPQLALAVDANAAYVAADARRFYELDRFGLAFIEQPLPADDLAAHAALQTRLSTPICLDESVTGPRAARQALAAGAARLLNIKPGRVGGHAAARQVHDVAWAFDAPVWCGGMLETGVGRAHNLHLATLANFRMPGDLSSSSRYWETDLVDEPLEAVDGWMDVPAGPGIGVTVNRECLQRVRVAHHVLAL